jgi:hypothetical protein
MFSHVVLRRPASCFGRPIRSRLPRRQLRPLPLCSRGPSCEPIRRPFLIRLIGEEVTHTSGFPLGIESRDPDIPSCWHSGTMRPSCCWSIPCHNQADPVPTAYSKRLTATANRLILAPDESLQVDLVRLDRNIPAAGCVASRESCPSTSTQRVAAQVPEARSVTLTALCLPRSIVWLLELSFPKIPSGSDSRAEAESAHHPARCSHSFSCLECLSPTCSGRGASLKSRTSFFAISSILLKGRAAPSTDSWE